MTQQTQFPRGEDTPKEILFVGGPFDGEIKAFKGPLKPKFPVPVLDKDGGLVRYDYRLEVLRGPTGDSFVYCYGVEDVIAALCNGYKQAVIESPETQALRKDAERLAFMADGGWTFAKWAQPDGTVKYRLEWYLGNDNFEWQKQWHNSPGEAVDAAMEAQK